MMAASLVGVLALSACGGEAAGKSNSDLLKEAITNMKAVKTYHLTADIDQAGQAIKLVGDIDLTNNNMKLDVDSAGTKVSVIQVGTKVYLSMDGGANYTESSEGGAITEGFASFTKMWDGADPATIDAAKDQLKDGTPATETIDGVSTKHITGDAAALSALNPSGGGNSTGTVDIWVGDNAKPYIRQMKVDSTGAGEVVKGTLTWTKIDQAVDIKAP